MRIFKFSLIVIGIVPAFLFGAYVFLFGRAHPDNPDNAIISFEGLITFTEWLVSDGAGVTMEQGAAGAYLRSDNKALRRYINQFSISEDALINSLDAHRSEMAELLARTPELVAQESAIRAAYRDFQRAYPEAVFPPLYIIHGNYEARALIRPFGIIIAAEFFSSPASGSDPGNRHHGLLNPPAALTAQVIHELAHIQQARRHPWAVITGAGLLEYAITEGTADFVAEQITGINLSTIALEFIDTDAERYWCIFFDAIAQEHNRDWLNHAAFQNRPRGIPRAFGYRIAESYFQKAEDKTLAFRELIELADFNSIYKNSKYSDGALCKQFMQYSQRAINVDFHNG